MARNAWLVALIVLTAGLTGCLGGSDDAGSQTTTASTEDPSVGQSSTKEANETNETEAAAEDGPDLNVTVINGTLTQSGTPAGELGYCNGVTATCDADFDFQVTNATTAVVAELVWESSANLRIELDVPTQYCQQGPAGEIVYNCPDGAQTSGGSPLRLDMTRSNQLERTGTWDGDLIVDDRGPSTVEYTLYLTIVSGGELPSGYSNVNG